MKLNLQGLKWNNPVKKVIERITGGEKGLLFLANERKRLMDPYVPADKLMLAQHTQVYVKDHSGIVEYMSPYAHYQYKGILYVSSKTGSAWSRGEYKVPTDRNIEHDKFRHPLATSEWDKAMWAARGDDLIQAYQNYIVGGAR